MAVTGRRDDAFYAVADRSGGDSVTSADRSDGRSVAFADDFEGDPVVPTSWGGGVGESIGAPDGSGVIQNTLLTLVGRAVPEG